MKLLFFCFCFFCLHSSVKASIAPAAELLKDLTKSYVAHPTVPTKNDIERFILTGAHDPYTRLNYERFANPAERKIIFKALITTALTPSVDDFQFYWDQLSVSEDSPQATLIAKHQLNSLMVVYLASGRKSGHSVRQVIDDFCQEYQRKERLFTFPLEAIQRDFEKLDKNIGFNEAYADILPMNNREESALRIQKLYRGYKTRKKHKEAYEQMMGNLRNSEQKFSF